MTLFSRMLGKLLLWVSKVDTKSIPRLNFNEMVVRFVFSVTPMLFKRGFLLQQDETSIGTGSDAESATCTCTARKLVMFSAVCAYMVI